MKILFTLFFLSLFHRANGQYLPISDQLSVGGLFDELFQQGPRTVFNSENDYYVATNSSSNISGTKTENCKGEYDVWITKLDENNNILWDKTLGGLQSENISALLMCNNLLYVMAASTSGISGDKTINNFGDIGTTGDIWLLCLDENGAILWQTAYGGTGGEGIGNMVDYTDSSLIMISSSNSPISGNKTVGLVGYTDLWLLEISKTTGQIIQQKGIGSDSFESFPEIVKSSINDHIYVMCYTDGSASGDKTDPGFGSDDVWVIELDQNWNVLRDKCFGGNGVDQKKHQNIIIAGNNIYLSSHSSSPISGNKTVAPFYNFPTVFDYWLLKLDLELNLIWDKVYGGTGSDMPTSMFMNNNGNLVLGGVSQANASGNKTSQNFNTTGSPTNDGWVLILDDNGNILQQSTYGGGDDDFVTFQPFGDSNTDMLLLSNSKSPISGNKTVGTYGDYDIWLAKIDGSDFLNTPSINENSKILVYPNPFNDEVHFNFGEIKGNCQLSFYSMDGKLIHSETVTSGVTQKTVNIPNGQHVVLYELKNEDFIQTGKLIRN